MTAAEHTKILDRLATLLRARPRTAREIAKAMGCCKPAAYARIRALIARGDRLTAVAGPAGHSTGPASIVYGVR